MASKLIWKHLASQIMAETITEERIWCALRFHELDAFRYRANRERPEWASGGHQLFTIIWLACNAYSSSVYTQEWRKKNLHSTDLIGALCAIKHNILEAKLNSYYFLI